jgi:hypothetical protein
MNVTAIKKVKLTAIGISERSQMVRATDPAIIPAAATQTGVEAAPQAATAPTMAAIFDLGRGLCLAGESPSTIAMVYSR